MIYTAEQFKKITDGDNFIYLDDLPFDNQGLDFFNALPEHLQGQAVHWGTNDTVFRDDLLEYMIENQFGMTVKQYYSSTISKNKNIPIDFTYLPGHKKTPDIRIQQMKDEDKYLPNFQSIIIHNKEYHGYEDFFDFDKDMTNVLIFDNVKIPSEFTGIIKVTVEYNPSKEDIESLNK